MIREKQEVPLLEMRGIRKKFGNLEVVHGVDLSIRRGEVLALVGENGAGKSTMIKILAGNFPQTAGEILLDGEKLPLETPLQRIDRGIAVIYQELNYYNELSVAENLFVGRYPMKGSGLTRRLDKKKMRTEAVKILKSVHLDIDPDAPCKTLSVAQKQLLEIAKAVSRNAQIVVMDEPTSALNDAEVENLFGIVRQLKEKGVSVIYISHKLDEIFVICDRVHIMRDGNRISDNPIGDVTRAQIVSDMVGRDVSEMFKRNRSPHSELLLEVKQLSTADGRIKNINLNVRRGEIVTLYGLMGAGRGHILETIFGIHAVSSGEIIYMGKKVNIRSPEDAIGLGMAFVPSERKTDGIILSHSIGKNLSLPSLKDFNLGYRLNKRKEKAIVEESMQYLAIKAASENVLVSSLSGGNQQKVVIGKWMNRKPDLFIMHEPTKGIDVGTKNEIYKLLDSMCASGSSVLLVTSELPEVISLSDRVYIVREGRIVGELDGQGLTQEELMHKAIGGFRYEKQSTENNQDEVFEFTN